MEGRNQSPKLFFAVKPRPWKHSLHRRSFVPFTLTRRQLLPTEAPILIGRMSSYIEDTMAFARYGNKDMAQEKDFYSFEEIKDEFIGREGTPKREEYEANLRAHFIGEAIKRARHGRNLTQAQLGDMVGVQRSQISKIESGKSVTFSTISRVFKAMGVSAKLDLGSLGRVALW